MKEYTSDTFHGNKNQSLKEMHDNLPDETRENLLERLSTIQELLKQFWASYPLTTSNLIDKGRRLKDAMTERYKKLQVMEESIESEFGGKHSLLVQPVFEVCPKSTNIGYYNHVVALLLLTGVEVYSFIMLICYIRSLMVTCIISGFRYGFCTS
eukprot:Gb_37920 [translate_table: standard]